MSEEFPHPSARRPEPRPAEDLAGQGVNAAPGATRQAVEDAPAGNPDAVASVQEQLPDDEILYEISKTCILFALYFQVPLAPDTTQFTRNSKPKNNDDDV